jgi:AraC-like DNA-binding protein
LQKRLIDQKQLVQSIPAFTGFGTPEAKIDPDVFLLSLARLDRLEKTEDMAIMAALSQEVTDLGLFGKCLVFSESLWTAIDVLRHVVRYFQTGTDITIRIRRGRVTVRYLHPFGQGRTAQWDARYATTLLYNLVCQAQWKSRSFIEVGFPGARNVGISAFSLASRVLESSEGYVEFDENLLKSPMSRSDPIASELLQALLLRLTEQKESEPKLGLLITTMQFVSLEKYNRPVSLREAASLLSIPQRTLQAALSAEKTGFRVLRDNARHQLAKQALQNGRSITETASLIGFDHRQSFSEAFSIWEGCAPSQFVSRSAS